jgi:hypothetical protein
MIDHIDEFWTEVGIEQIKKGEGVVSVPTERNQEFAKNYMGNEFIPQLSKTKTMKKGIKLTKEQKADIKARRAYAKQQREELAQSKKDLKREVNILRFMLKTDVLFYHHGKADSMKPTIKKVLETCKVTKTESWGEVEWNVPNSKVYDPYYWNYSSDKSSYMPKSYLGSLWNGPFETIYDVPLDGSYEFYIVDSGQRGSGSFSYLSAKKLEEITTVPEVNPGAWPPISC